MWTRFTSSQAHLDDAVSEALAGQVQRGLSAANLSVGISVAIQQKVDHFEVAIRGSEMQRSFQSGFVAKRVDECSGIQKQFCALQVVELGGNVKGRATESIGNNSLPR